MAATVGWPAEEWGRDAGTYTELRPGCFDLNARLDDMDANGVLASMCFPSMAGYNARTFAEAPDKDLSLIMLQAYNDWHIDEWCAQLQRPADPARHAPDVGRRASPRPRCAGWRRRAARRSASSRRRTRRATRACCPATGIRCCRRSSMRAPCCACTSAAAMSLIKLPPRRPADHSIIVPTQVMTLVAQDLLFGRRSDEVPDPQGRLLRGRHRLDPVLPRAGRPPRAEPEVAAATTSAASCPRRSSASTSWPASSPTRSA